MNEEIKKLLADIAVKKMFAKNALKSYSQMMKITGLNYDKEINTLLDQIKKLEEWETKLKGNK
ncbi:MAG: hypothetical protein LUF85_02390 [Bacteroides sp.]|nr:hypothetical protein [Bacteroides sp.]